MKKLLSTVLAASLLIGSTAFAQGARDVSDARTATEQWMKLMDTEEYSAAWNSSAEGVRKEMPKLAWNLLATTVHLPLGTLKGRSFKSADIKAAAADKPASISFEYVADYEKNHHVRESVTTVRDKDGVWRVSGYGINADDSKSAKQ